MIEEKRSFNGGLTSTKQPRLSLIPHLGLVNAAKRFELGLEKHGPDAYNALRTDQQSITDRDWLIERCSHSIEHLYRLIDFLTGKKSNLEDAIGDAGAVAWCGLVLGEALEMANRSEDSYAAMRQMPNEAGKNQSRRP